MPSMRLPRSGSQCSRTSRLFTLLIQHPSSQPSGAIGLSSGAGGGAAGVASVFSAGAPGDLRTHVAGVRESELEQAEQPPHPVIVDLGAIVQVVEQSARFGVEPDVPHPALIVDFALRAYRHLDAQEMRDPFL